MAAEIRHYVYERPYTSSRTGKVHTHRDRQSYQVATERCLQHMTEHGPLTRHGSRWVTRNHVVHFNNITVLQLVKAGSACIVGDVARAA